jgi:hypothetical protein
MRSFARDYVINYYGLHESNHRFIEIPECGPRTGHHANWERRVNFSVSGDIVNLLAHPTDQELEVFAHEFEQRPAHSNRKKAKMTTFENRPLSKLGLKGLLEQLTTLYYQGTDLRAYQRALLESRRQLRYAFPGLTVVLTEVADRDYTSTMMHVLAPETATAEHTLGWHDFYTAVLSLDDGKTDLSEIASLEVKQEDGTWLAGTVSAGGPASQHFLITTATGEQRFLQYGDTTRNITFRDKRTAKG